MPPANQPGWLPYSRKYSATWLRRWMLSLPKRLWTCDLVVARLILSWRAISLSLKPLRISSAAARAQGDAAQQPGDNPPRGDLFAVVNIDHQAHKIGQCRGSRDIADHAGLGPGDDVLFGFPDRAGDNPQFGGDVERPSHHGRAVRHPSVEQDDVGAQCRIQRGCFGQARALADDCDAGIAFKDFRQTFAGKSHCPNDECAQVWSRTVICDAVL